MSVICKLTHFDKDGLVCGGGQSILAPFLDRLSIVAKAVYVIHIGGLPAGTTHTVVDSQGKKMLVPVPVTSTGDLKHAQYKELYNGAEAEVRRICHEWGIDLTRIDGNQ